MKNPVKLVENIKKNMEYLKLLLIEGHQYAVPLHTYDLVRKQLETLQDMLAFIHLTEPITLVLPDDMTLSPFYRDSVGGEEMGE